MYCQHCGNKLSDNDKFCHRCGTKVEKDSISSSTGESSLTDSSVEELGALQTENKDASFKSSEAAADSSSDESEEAAASATNADGANTKKNTLKAAVASNRKRSRRKMPLILVVALVLALVSSIAYAAYYIYSQYFAPQQQVVQTQEQPESTDSETEATYTSEVVTQTVQLPEEGLLYGGSEQEEWNYIQFSSSVENEHLKELNAQIREEFEAVVDETESWTIDSIGDGDYSELTLSRGSEVTYLKDSIASVRTTAYETNLGPHGWHTYSNAIYDLSTGKQITPAEYFQVDQETIYQWTYDAISAWLENNEDETDYDYSNPQDQKYIEEMLSGYKEDADYLYYLTEEGLVVCTNDYDLGTYAAGTKEIIVKAFNDDSLVGTAIDRSVK